MLENAFGYGCVFGIVTFLCLSIAIVDELFRINSSTNQPEKISLGKEPILQYEASSGKVIGGLRPFQRKVQREPTALYL